MWLSQLLSQVGTQMQSVALHWHIYLLTGSPLALGAVGLTRAVPTVLFSLWGGVLADRRDRRLVMLAAQSAMTVVALALAIYARYVRRMTGPWRRTYVVTALIALYFNCVVLIAQSFSKVPALNALAPTQSEPPFAIAQGILLVAAIVFGILAVRRFDGGAIAQA